ncbi:hypothetical protein SRHO_G00164360 [Serrasalmus rhombeus]
MKISNTRQTEEEWNREKQREDVRTRETEEQRADISTEVVVTVVKREMEEKKEKQDDGKIAAVSEQQEVMKEKKSEEEQVPELEKQREEEWLEEDRERQEAVESRKEVIIEMENLETGVLTVHIRSCRDFSKTTRIQKGCQCMVRITVGDMVKCSMLPAL